MGVSRREVLAAGAFSLLGGHLLAAAKDKPRNKIIAFTKPFQKASPTEIADIVAEVGWDGVECPVRPKGQIEPERVEDELPRFVEAMKKVGREVTMLTTGIKTLTPEAEKVLRTAAKLGIRRYRLSFWNYNPAKPVAEHIAEVRAATNELAALNKELGICGAHQNHSGANFFGAPIWDIYEAVKDCDPKYFGICFDIGHARIEGGLSWPVEMRLTRSYFTAVFVKDYIWKKTEKGWRNEWCPLGEGMVPPEFFKLLKQSNYDGPISQHHEYEIGEGRAMIDALKKDLAVLKGWLAAA